MKKIIYLIALLSVCLLAGCADKKENKQDNKSSVLESEQQDTKEKLEYYDYCNGLSETENGYYFYSNSMRITYIDKETMEATPLCFQPNCEHPSDESCPAYARFIRRLQLYKGKLYADITVDKDIEENVCSYMNLYEMELDGSNRRRVLELYNTEDLLESESSNYSLCWYIIDDIIYVSASQSGEEGVGIAYIDRYSLSTGKKIDRLYEEKLKGSNTSVDYELYAYDALRQEVYLSESRWEEVDSISEDAKQQLEEEDIAMDENWGGVTVELSDYFAKCNIQNKTLQRVFPEEKVSSIFIFQGQVYLRQGSTLYEYDSATEKKTPFLTLEEEDQYAVVSADENYIYVDNNLAQIHEIDGKKPKKEELFLKIYNKDKELVDKINVPLPVCRRFYGTDKMFFLDNNKCYYLDKTKIGTGELQLQEIKGVK